MITIPAHRVRLLGACVVALAATTLQAQQPAVTFRSSADYIEVAVQAHDRDGRPVTDLKPEELRLFEDGKPQDIATFAAVNTPIERRPIGAASAHAAVAIGETARVTNAAAREGRTFILFVDAMHIAAERTVPARQMMKHFVMENMAENDVAAVIVTGGLTPSQDFTSDKGTLLAAIDRVTGDRLPSRILMKWRHKIDLPYDYIGDPYYGDRAARAAQSLTSLRRVVQMLAGLGGRRTALLYVSEGFDLNLDDRIGRAGGPHQAGAAAGRSPDPQDEFVSNATIEAALAGQVADELQLTVEAASRANVAIYTVDPRGLADPAEDLIQIAGPLDDNKNGAPFIPSTAMRQEVVRTQQFLRDVAGRTGGRAIVNTNNFAKPFDDIMQDSSNYYLLTYRMSHRDDGHFHRITVRSSRPGVTVTARDGYYAPRSGGAAKATRSPLAGLLESPIQLPGLSMSAASTVIPSSSGSSVRFAVEFAGDGLRPAGQSVPVIDVAYVVTDDDGKVLAQQQRTLRLAVSESMRASLESEGLRYVAEVAAPPGRHHVRFAARNNDTQAMGSLFWDIDVPKVPPSGVAVSPIVLASQQADTMPTISDVRGGSVVDGLMTARRTFRAEDVLSVATLVANGRQKDALTGSFVITTEDGREVARREAALPEAGKSSSTAVFRQRVSLDTLTPGRYRADFQVRAANGDVRGQRAVVFDVERRNVAIW